MDLDILADILNQDQPVLSGSLLSHLLDTRLTSNHRDVAFTQIGSSNTAVHSFETVNADQSRAVISKIEDVFENIADCILDERKELIISLKTRGKKGTKAPNEITGTIQNLPNNETRTVRFPCKSPQEAWKFTALLRILELSHEALVTGVVTTKRDIYYRDPKLFIKQAVVDRYVDDIAYTLGLERDSLNVVAAAKGLVVGAFALTRNDESMIDYAVEPEGILVPNTKDIRLLQLVDVNWILVIEKEATFCTLAMTQYWKTSLAGKGIIITAKGYPDIKTRQFLYLLSTHAPAVPIFALVDFDPDGLGIMSTYKYGSMALAHENQNLAVPSIQWLGVRSSDIMQDEFDKTGLLKLSSRDRKIAMRMLEKEVFEERGREQEWRREMQVMLTLNVKAEIQILSAGKGLEAWLDGKLVFATS